MENNSDEASNAAASASPSAQTSGSPGSGPTADQAAQSQGGGSSSASPRDGPKPVHKLKASESERNMSGLKPKVTLRKRGMSFRETKRINLAVDDQGRRHLNQYTFFEELGRGAYGVVLRVQSNETKEFFAAKTVDKKALRKVRVGRFGNALQSVKKELAIWQKFKHRHIVVLREVIDSDDCNELYMISELIDGGTVLDGETECTPLNAEQTKLYFCQLIEGIDFLHENKVIHRDIKPGNLLLKKGEDGEMILKIADFGVSHEMESDDESLRQTAGTAIFMAPEMLTGNNFRGKPVDIWACGITLYMFVYGHPPFMAKTMTELYSKIQNDTVEYPKVVGDRLVEDDLIDLLKKILEKDPQMRYTTQQIRAHPWAWREFQVSAVKCVTHPEGRRSSFSQVPKTFSAVVSVGRSLRQLFSRKSVVPTNTPRATIDERQGM
ncbi:hypothetical protein PINS_up010846 [Pythium insidiosum]|nr:hypothetical protein PINS_up010846 [Pythium insidiosum]